jgi:hypothetical protein
MISGGQLLLNWPHEIRTPAARCAAVCGALPRCQCANLVWFDLGGDAGYAPQEFAAFGLTTKERGSRLKEGATPGIPRQAARASLELLAREVLPVLRQGSES